MQWLTRSHKTLNVQAYQTYGTDSTVCIQQQESSTPTDCESSTDVNPTTATAQHPLASDSVNGTDYEQSSSSHIRKKNDRCTRSSGPGKDCIDIIIVSAAFMLHIAS